LDGGRIGGQSPPLQEESDGHSPCIVLARQSM